MSAAAPAANNSALAALGGLPIIVIFIVIMYLVLFLPQRQQNRRRKEMLQSLKVGDEVITAGGIHGRISVLKDDEVLLRVADKVDLTLSRSSISSVKRRD